MHSPTKLTNPHGTNQRLFKAALKFNKVYSPRLSSLPAIGIAARRMDAVR